VDLLELGAACVGNRLRERQFGMRLQAGERRAQLVRRVGQEALLVEVRFAHATEQAVEGVHQLASFLRRLAFIDRVEVARRARTDFLRQPCERFEPHRQPPNASGRAQASSGSTFKARSAHQTLALDGHLRDDDGADSPPQSTSAQRRAYPLAR
jgi:hypothetical protein